MDTTIMDKKVQVLSKDSKEVLFECSIEDEATAYAYAAQMEEIGVDVFVLSPNVVDTLSSALGLGKDEEDAFKHSVYQEIEDHEGSETTDSCCTTYVEVSDKSTLQ